MATLSGAVLAAPDKEAIKLERFPPDVNRFVAKGIP
jgi:hypothetical protein